VSAKAFYYFQGLDSAGKNFGSNPFLSNTTRIRDDGFKIGSGNKATCFNGIFQVSYEWKENLFVDVSAQYRTYKIDRVPGESKTTLVTAGIRLNMFKRDYDF
jgi:hypothetical protein